MKRTLLSIVAATACSLLVQCPMPWHGLDNPVDPGSPTYIGEPSRDNKGNGIPQYVDVDEIELAAPAQEAVLDVRLPSHDPHLQRTPPGVSW